MYEGTIDQSPYQRMTITSDLVSAIYGRQCYVLISTSISKSYEFYVYVFCIVTSPDDYIIIMTYNRIPLSVDIIVTISIGPWTSDIAYSMH